MINPGSPRGRTDRVVRPANPQSNPISKTGRDHHYVADRLDGGAEDSTTAAHVGPGSYSADQHTVAKKSMQSRGRPSGAFASTSLRGDLFMGGPG